MIRALRKIPLATGGFFASLQISTKVAELSVLHSSTVDNFTRPGAIVVFSFFHGKVVFENDYKHLTKLDVYKRNKNRRRLCILK